MNKDDKLRRSIEGIDENYIEEAYLYKKPNVAVFISMRVAVVAVVAAIVAIVYNVFLYEAPISKKCTFKVYAQEIEALIEDEYAYISTGVIHSESSKSIGMANFHFEGEDVESIRFSCKNGYISLYAYEQEYDRSKNFTVDCSRYGENDYRGMSLSWLSENIVDNGDKTGDTELIPEVERYDVIVVEVSYKNGKKECFAIELKWDSMENVYAKFVEYTITAKDQFVYREDAISYQEQVSKEMETATSADDVINTTKRELTEEQINSIYNAASEYYSHVYFMITDMEIVDKDALSLVSHLDYTADQLVYLHVWGPEHPKEQGRHIIIGSKDDWVTCEVLGEGY